MTPGEQAEQAYREGRDAPAGSRNPYSGRPFLAALWQRGHQHQTDKTISADGED